MNLGFLDGGTAAHEFGHAIGLGHEHQNPAGGIEWNEEVVLRDLVTRRLEQGGPIVGLFESASYQEEAVRLATGDWLIVFSDGISEALSAAGDEYGEGRIISFVESRMDYQPQQLLDALFADVREFARGAAQSDDITAMVLRYGR